MEAGAQKSGEAAALPASPPPRSLKLLVFFPETVYIWITLFFKPKMDLISTIIVFGFLEIQSNNVPVDDKPYQGIF